MTEQLVRVFIIQLMRLPDLHRYARSISIFADFLGLPESFFSPLHHGVEALEEFTKDSYSSLTSKLLKDYSTNIIEIVKERRVRSFLLPSSHFIGYGKYLILVLTPYWGIMLIPESENRNLVQEGLLRYLAATSDNDVDLINKEAESYERTLSNQKLVGLLPELEILKQRRKQI